jgi:single-strand DNA-binding protein
MNHCVLTGNLGADPQNFFTPDGVPITTFQLAFRSGKDKTSWMKVTCFHKLAELSARCLHIGARVGIIGALEQTKWNDDNGNARTGYRLIANNIEFIKTDGRGFDHNNGENAHEGDEVPFD